MDSSFYSSLYLKQEIIHMHTFQTVFNDIQNIKMQKIISQIPQLASYLARVPRKQHLQAIKQLIRTGLQTVNSVSGKQNSSRHSNVIRKQLDQIKQNIEELNSMVKHQNYNYCRCCQPGPHQGDQRIFQAEPTINKDKYLKEKATQFARFQKKNAEKPVKDGPHIGTINFSKNQQINPFAKNKAVVARLLDDTGVREALTFPIQALVENESRGRQKSSSYRKHIYQEQINKEDLGKIKQDKGQSIEKLRRDRTVSDYSKATSKIKTLIEKDKIRFTQRQRDHEFKEGFNKYQYSDQNQMEQSSMHEEEAKAYQARLQQPHFAQANTYDQHLQSSFKASNQASSSQKSQQKASSKKSFERSKNQVSSNLQGSLGEQYHKRSEDTKKYQGQRLSGSQKYDQEEVEDEDDVISNSSSFSQFSMEGSRRKQVGKISRRSQND